MHSAVILAQAGSLGDMLRKQLITPYNKMYSDADALRWAVQLASALQALHDGCPQIIHRDIKLDNVLLAPPPPEEGAPKGTLIAKLADLGLHVVRAGQGLWFRRPLDMGWARRACVPAGVGPNAPGACCSMAASPPTGRAARARHSPCWANSSDAAWHGARKQAAALGRPARAALAFWLGRTTHRGPSLCPAAMAVTTPRERGAAWPSLPGMASIVLCGRPDLLPALCRRYSPAAKAAT